MDRLGEKIICNPSVKLIKGQLYSFVDMDKLTPGYKYVEAEPKEYSGSGTKFENGDTLMARITPCLQNGKISQCRIDGNGFGSTEFYVFRGWEGKTDNDYVYYLMNTQYIRRLAENSMTGASGRQRADLKFIKRIKWQFPSLETQKKIASVLNVYDEIIDINNKRIDILESIVGNLYREWFSHFRFPGWQNKSFINEIPKGWSYKRVDECMTFIRGISYSSDEIDTDEGVNLINLKNIDSFGGFRRDGTKRYDGKYKKSQIATRGSLIMGVTDMTQDRRTVGAVALMPTLEGISVISADLVLVESSYNNVFLYCMFKYGPYSKYFSQFANGANVLHLKPNSMNNKKLLMPEKELIELFVEKANPMIDMIDSLHMANDNLTKQRDAILPVIMEGKIVL